jgi:hypothetical protein
VEAQSYIGDVSSSETGAALPLIAPAVKIDRVVISAFALLALPKVAHPLTSIVTSTAVLELLTRQAPPPPPAFTTEWINEGINSIGTAKEASYRPWIERNGSRVVFHVPTGRFEGGRIHIPNGTRGLILRGQGRGKTTLVNTARVHDFVAFGQFNATVPRGQTVQIKDVKPGDEWIHLAEGESGWERVTLPMYGLVWDDNVVIGGTQTTRIVPNRQFVRFLEYDRAGRRIKVDWGGDDHIHAIHRTGGALHAFRNYEQPLVGPVKAQAGVTPWTVIDVGLESLSVDGGGRDRPVTAVFGDRITYRDLEVYNYGTGGLHVKDASRVTIEDCHVRDASGTAAGGGYAYYLRGVSNFLVQRTETSGRTRHSFIAHSGTRGGTVASSTYRRGSIDTHGMNEGHIWFRDITCFGMTIGNEGFMGGGRNFLITNSQINGELQLMPNVSGVKVSGGFVQQVVPFGRIQPEGAPNIPRTGMPDNMLFEGVKLERVRVAGNWRRFGKLEFIDCTHVMERDEMVNWARFVHIDNGSGDLLRFVRSRFIRRPGSEGLKGRAPAPFRFSNLRGTPMKVEFVDCEMRLELPTSNVPHAIAQVPARGNFVWDSGSTISLGLVVRSPAQVAWVDSQPEWEAGVKIPANARIVVSKTGK